MSNLQVGRYYRIRCKSKKWGMSGYGEWEFLYISDDGFCFQDWNGATLTIPRQPVEYFPSDPWILELLDN